MEATLRKEIGVYRSGMPFLPLVRRARILVGTYEDIARLFPGGSYADKALWQGASLAADVFDVFKDNSDRASAVRLTELLDTRYARSPFLAQAHRRVGTLALAVASTEPASQPTPLVSPSPAPLVSQEVTAAAAPPAAPARPVARVPATSAVTRTTTTGATTVTTTLQAIHREVLPDVLRVSIELDREIPFHEERLDGPSRVFRQRVEILRATPPPATRSIELRAEVVRLPALSS